MKLSEKDLEKEHYWHVKSIKAVRLKKALSDIEGCFNQTPQIDTLPIIYEPSNDLDGD